MHARSHPIIQPAQESAKRVKATGLLAAAAFVLLGAAAFAIAGLLPGCAAHVPAAAGPGGAGAVDLSGMDRSVAPGDDFFRFANGAWLKSTEIPPDRASTGVGEEVYERTVQRGADLIREAAKSGSPQGSAAQLVGDYFAAYMDEAAIEAKGLAPLRPAFDRIAAVADRKHLSAALGRTLRADVDALNATDLDTDNILGLWVAQDLNDPTRYAAFLLQGGLEMPDRSYYLDPAPRMADYRAKYLAHVARVLELAQVPDAAARAARIAALETHIAEVHWTREDTEDVKKANNHWPRDRFDADAPGVDWAEFFGAAGLGGQRDFVVWQPSALIGISRLVASEPIDTWKDYLTFHAIEHASAVLPRAFGEEAFAFYGTTLTGVPKRRDRWKRATDATGGALGDAVGRLYAERYFPPESKARVEEMVRNITAAFGRRIDALDWMTPATKARARAKLATLKVGVGYPDRFIDYSGLAVARGDAFGNLERTELFELRCNLAKLGRPVDRGEWVTAAHVVNAFNLPAMNAMNFPAGMLQAPFFDPARPAAMDYGAIGAIIGHEVSHSFDDLGSQFDEHGRLDNWWTPADRAHFDAATAALVQQYDAYRPFPDLSLNGKLTLNENIADLAGLAAAYDAYRISLGNQPAPAVAGLTGDQQFLLSYAMSWRAKIREAALRQKVVVDVHAPDQYRVYTVRNLDPWYAAFEVKPGQKLYLPPDQRVRVW